MLRPTEDVSGWNVPKPVLELAMRLGASGDGRSVEMTQIGEMRNGPSSSWMAFAASQQISLRQTEFEWRASTGPFGSVSIVDALRADRTVSEVRLLR